MAASGNSRSMESRVGRDKQRYSENEERLIAGVVPLNDAKDQVMLTQSTRGKGWVLPKGGWELDEASAKEAAAREAWEEAGIEVHIDMDLGETQGPAYKSRGKAKGPALYHFFQATVIHIADDWPEKDKRDRKWFSIPDAMVALQDRPELYGALCRATESLRPVSAGLLNGFSTATEAISPQTPSSATTSKSAAAGISNQ